MDRSDSKPAIGGMILLCIGCALLAVSAGFLTFAFNEWLRLGAWPDYPLSRLLAELAVQPPRLGRGQAAVDWLLSLGVCTFFLWTGGAFALLGGWRMLAHDKRQRLDRLSA